MLQAIKPKNKSRKTPKYSRSIIQEHINTQKKHLARLNIEIFKDDSLSPKHNPQKNSTLDNFYKTQSHSWRPSHVRHTHHQNYKSYKFKQNSLKQSIIGVPFKSLQFEQKNMDNAVYSMMDRQKYKYLLKAISGINKGKNLSQIRYQDQEKKPIQNADSYSANRVVRECISPFDTQIKNRGESTNLNQTSARQKSQNLKQKRPLALETPRIINLSSKLKTRQNKRSIQKDNPFVKMFKNKKKLQNKLYNTSQDDRYELTILGEYQLTIHQIPFHHKNHK